MDDLAKLGLEDFLDRTADRTPTPGGGGVTGLAGALACALARMVAAYSIGKKTGPEQRERVERTATQLHRADQLLRALIAEDAVAYSRMTEAAKRAKQDAAATADHQAAVLAAMAVPLEMAAVVSQALSTLDEFKADASRYLLSDLAIAAVLAEATAQSARYTVQINAGELTDADRREKLLSDIALTVEHCSKRRASIEAYVRAEVEA